MKKLKIIQIVVDDGYKYGLGNDGVLYKAMLNTKKTGEYEFYWKAYVEPLEVI